jgi:pyridoxal phosphate enzyme (YggS family)
MNRDRLRDNLAGVRARITDAARRSGRQPSDVTLVAVTKRSPPDVVAPLIELGVRDLGENYPQELWRKVELIGRPEVRWHLIGHLQGNKVKRTLPLVRMIHAVDSLKLLESLDGLAAELADPPAVCLQVNCSGEASKHGWSPDAILENAHAIARCQRIQIAGLMTMAALELSSEAARPAFARLRETRDVLRARTGMPLNALSMGMSNDYDVAVEEGATLVRIGSAIFDEVVP